MRDSSFHSVLVVAVATLVVTSVAAVGTVGGVAVASEQPAVGVTTASSGSASDRPIRATASGQPTADAGPNQTATAGVVVPLDATESSDPDGDTLNYSWRQVSGPFVELVGVRDPAPTFTAPESAAGSTVTFEVTVTDPTGQNDTDRVSVQLVAPNSSESTVSRVGFDYGEYGGNLNLEVNGEFRNFDQFSDAPPTGVNDTTVGGANVTVRVINRTASGVRGRVEIVGNVSSIAVGGQELWLDNVTFGGTASTTVTFAGVSPLQSEYRVAEAFRSEGVAVGVERFTYANGNTTTNGFGQRDNTTPALSGGTAPDFNTNNVNLRFDVASAVAAPDGGNAPPVADPGPNRTVEAGRTIELDGTNSSDPDGDPLTYYWNGTAPSGTLGDRRTATPTFTAPAVSTTTTYRVFLGVTDPGGLRDTAGTYVTVDPAEPSPNGSVSRVGFDYGEYGGNVNLEVNGDFVNTDDLSDVPTSVGGVPVTVTNQSVSGGVQGHVELAGDVTSLAVGGQELFIDNVEFGPASGPHANVTFGNVTPRQPNYTVGESFTADGVPVSVENYTYSGGTVTSGGQAEILNRSPAASGGTPPDAYPGNVNLRFDVGAVAGAAPQTPTADAGPDQATAPARTVALNASGSSDPNADPLNYSWQQTDGPAVTLGDANASTAVLDAPSVTSVTTLSFVVTVSDPEGNDDTDVVNVTVEPTDVATDGVARVGFDYGEYGGNLNLEVNGAFRNFDRYSRGPPAGVDGTFVGGVQVRVTNRTVPGGEQGHVELVGNISSVSLGGQELFVDNVEFGVDPTPKANVTFRNLTPVQSGYPVGDTFTADGVNVTVDPFVYSDGTVTNTSQARPQNQTPANSGGTAPDMYPDNVNLRFDVAGAASLGTGAGNDPPRADAGPNRTVAAGQTIVLDGTNSSDPDGDPLTYYWNGTAPLGAFGNQSSATTTFTGPNVSSPTTYRVLLGVTDSGGLRDVDETFVTVEPTAPSNGSVSRIGFDYGEYGGNLNIEVNGEFRNFDRFSDAPPTGINDTTIGGANVTVQVLNQTAGGVRGRVEIVGNVSAFSVGGQELWLDNVEFGGNATTSPTTVTFDNVTPVQSDYRVNDSFLADGVGVTVDPFVYSDGTVTSGGFGQRDNATAPLSGGTTPDFNTNNVNLAFDVASAAAESPPSNRAPRADAGANRTVRAGQTILLDGTNSSDPDGDPLTYYWNGTAPSGTIGNRTTATPTFTAPAVSSPTTYRVFLGVTDPGGLRDMDETLVTVEPTTTAPPNGSVSRIGFDYGEYGGNLNIEVNGEFRNFDRFSDAPPTGINDTTIGGANVTVQVLNRTAGGVRGHVEIVGNVSAFSVGGQELWLDNVEFGGANATPPRAVVTFGNVSPTQARYRVTDTFRADGVPVSVENFTYSNGNVTAGGFGQLDNATPPLSGGTTPDINTNNVNLRFDVAAAANETAPNAPPTADAGPNQTVRAGETVTLDATGSSDPDDAATALTYGWLQVGGPPVTLTGATTATPTFTAPTVTTETTLTFEVLVRDGDGGRDVDTTTVTVRPPAGANVTTNATVLLREAPTGVYSYEIGLSATGTGETVLGVQSRLTPGVQVTAGGVGTDSITVRSIDLTNRTFDRPVPLFTTTFTGNLTAATLSTSVSNLTDDDRQSLNESLVAVRIDGDNPFPGGIPGSSTGNAPQNVDLDPQYEDLTGDGEFRFTDVIEFVFALDAIQNANLDDEAIARLDHSGDGRVTFVDVIDLVFQL